jgi:ribonucleoside-diphosphate reductase alpha chain
MKVDLIAYTPEPIRVLWTAARTGCGKIYVTVNSDEEGLVETFITTGSCGGCPGFAEGVSRLISLALRANVAPETIIDQLTSGSCPNFLRRRADLELAGKSCPDVIGRILASARVEQKIEAEAEPVEPSCPECGARLMHQEGCVSCRCGYSRCA